MTILFNIVDNYEQSGQQNIVQSCFHELLQQPDRCKAKEHKTIIKIGNRLSSKLQKLNGKKFKQCRLVLDVHFLLDIVARKCRMYFIVLCTEMQKNEFVQLVPCCSSLLRTTLTDISCLNKDCCQSYLFSPSSVFV